jgi:hypothetical protein
MKIFLTFLLLSSVSYGEIFVIDKDQEFPFKAAQIKKSFKKDISDYLDSTTPVLKRLEGAPFKLALFAVGPLVAASVGIGPWRIGGNVGFFLVFVRKKDQL